MSRPGYGRPDNKRAWMVFLMLMEHGGAVAWERYHAAAEAAVQNRDYETAEAEQLRAVGEAERLGPTDSRLASSLQDLLGIYFRTRKPAELVDPVARRLLTLQESIAGPESTELIPALNALARASRELGHYEEAEDHLRRALRIREQAMDDDTPAVVGELHALGVHLWGRKRYSEAEVLFVHARNILARHPSAQAPIGIAAILDCLAMMYQGWGQPAKAEPVLRDQLQVAEEDSNDVEFVDWTKAPLLARLAVAYRDQGKYELSDTAYAEAISHYGRALRRTVGARRFRKPETAGTSISLRASITMRTAWLRHERAEVLRIMARPGEAALQEAYAERSLKRAIAMEEARHRDDSIIVEALVGLAQVYLSVGKHAEAEPLYRRAIAIYRQAEKDQHEKLKSPEFAGERARVSEFYNHQIAVLDGEHAELLKKLRQSG